MELIKDKLLKKGEYYLIYERMHPDYRENDYVIMVTADPADNNEGVYDIKMHWDCTGVFGHAHVGSWRLYTANDLSVYKLTDEEVLSILMDII
jgi:hypothetical protein